MSSPIEVSAVVCTLNSVASIEQCLKSLRKSAVGELIVVDAGSTDGTREIAQALADQVLDDPGTGLGNARNIGIGKSTLPLVLNMGSDNTMPDDQLQGMIDCLEHGNFQGVSARTVIEGDDYVSRGLNAWREGRFRPGPAAVIGTPTLFPGDLLRRYPFDSTRSHSDDSELCERWSIQMGARFAISHAYVIEVGKTSWHEVVSRCRTYGISDAEVFRAGRASGWSAVRQLRSLAHPARSDFFRPLEGMPVQKALTSAPFLAAFTALRYAGWVEATTHQSVERIRQAKK